MTNGQVSLKGRNAPVRSSWYARNRCDVSLDASHEYGLRFPVASSCCRKTIKRLLKRQKLVAQIEKQNPELACQSLHFKNCNWNNCKNDNRAGVKWKLTRHINRNTGSGGANFTSQLSLCGVLEENHESAKDSLLKENNWRSLNDPTGFNLETPFGHGGARRSTDASPRFNP